MWYTFVSYRIADSFVCWGVVKQPIWWLSNISGIIPVSDMLLNIKKNSNISTEVFMSYVDPIKSVRLHGGPIELVLVPASAPRLV